MTEKELTASFLSLRELASKFLVNENESTTVTTSDVSGFGKFLTSFLAGLFHEAEARCLLCRSPGDAGTRRWEILRCAVACYLSSSTSSLVFRSCSSSSFNETAKKRASSKLKCRPDCSCLTPASRADVN